MQATEPLTVEQAADKLIAPLEIEETADEAEVDDGAPDEADAEVSDDADETEVEAAEAGGDPDEGDEEEQAEADEEPQRFTVKVDGETREVTLDELTRSYSGQAYIQKGMAEAAEARKQVEAVYEALNSERAALAQFAKQLQEQGVKPAPTPPPADLLNTDPIGYLHQKEAYEAAKAEYDAQQAQFRQAQEGQSRAMEQARQKFLREQAEALKALVPELADAKTARETAKRITDNAHRHYRLSPDEVAGIMDARHVAILSDAIKWRELQSSKAEKTKQATEKARPVIKAKATKAKDPTKAQREKARQRLKMTGSVDDAVALILNQ